MRLEEIARAKALDTIEIWFADEARIDKKNKTTRRWAKRGTRPSAPRDQRTASTYIFGAVPEGGQGCSPDHAGLQHRGDELAPRRDRRNRRARCPRHPPGRPSRLALVHAPPRAGQYHHHSAAAEMHRAQPGRERLAVHARQLALQPHLQILRRSRRPLLCGMEQARRPTLAHHVHRTAPMGPRVLIIGIWYNTQMELYRKF